MRVLFMQQDPFVAIGAMALSAFLKKHGHVVDMIVMAMEKDWLSTVGEFRPDVIALP